MDDGTPGSEITGGPSGWAFASESSSGYFDRASSSIILNDFEWNLPLLDPDRIGISDDIRFDQTPPPPSPLDFTVDERSSGPPSARSGDVVSSSSSEEAEAPLPVEQEEMPPPETTTSSAAASSSSA